MTHLLYWQALSCQLDALWPIVRDATSIARDSVRACALFATWSRKLGVSWVPQRNHPKLQDELRTAGLHADRLLSSCDELKNAFVEGTVVFENWEERKHVFRPSGRSLAATIAHSSLENSCTRVEEERGEAKVRFKTICHRKL